MTGEIIIDTKDSGDDVLVDLTDDEIWTLHDSYPNPVEFARAIEQLSKEKNL